MKWLLKAFVQNSLSALPRAHAVNHAFQRWVARSLPAGDAGFRRKVTAAGKHFDAFLAHGGRDPEEAVFYEFGAGWDLILPLAYASLGVRRQILVDIRPNVRFDLVGDTLEKYERHRADLERELGRPLRELGRPAISTTDELEERFGIRDVAPRDARKTGLPPRSVDFVSSTNTLEHIPERDIALILRECRRILRDDGVFSSRIDMRDHYSYFDATISPYNFLKFSERAWSLVNCSLHYQNRLRYPDYLRLVEEAGLALVAETVARASPADLETLRQLPLAESFSARYSLEDLGAQSLVLVARPAATISPEALAQRSTSP